LLPAYLQLFCSHAPVPWQWHVVDEHDTLYAVIRDLLQVKAYT